MSFQFTNPDLSETNKVTVGEFMQSCIDNASVETDREWKIKYCVKQLVVLHRSIYLNAYEALLIQKLQNAYTQQQKDIVKTHLKAYYGFLIAFDYKPLLDFNDGNESIFNDVYNTVPYIDAMKVFMQVYNIVVTNNKAHNEINKQIMDIACTDIDLKPVMVHLLQFPNNRRLLTMSTADLQSIFF